MVRLIAVLGVVVVTTTVALLCGRRLGRLSRERLRVAVTTTLEYVGLSAVFLSLNMLLGTIGVLAARAITEHFISVYVINDLFLVLLSFLQALFFGPLFLSDRSSSD